MPSIQSKITKWVLKFQFASWSAGTIDEQRARQEKSAGLAGLPSGTTCKPVDVNGVPAEWIEAPNSSRGVILYLHGGAYALGSVNIHRELIARLAHVTQCRALAINYRLAPENPFPAALEDTLSAYRWLTTQFSSSQIIIAGDSAGGGLNLHFTLGRPGINGRLRADEGASGSHPRPEKPCHVCRILCRVARPNISPALASIRRPERLAPLIDSSRRRRNPSGRLKANR
jgi:hypothetical protein